MGLELPHWAAEALNWCGLTWPEADEEKLFAAAQAWFTFAEQLRPAAATANRGARKVLVGNAGVDFEAFEQMWTGPDGPPRQVEDGAEAAELIGTALLVMAVITLSQKIITIVQLAVLVVEVSEALAAAVPTGGASTATIPAFIAACRVAIRRTISQVVHKIVHEIIPRLLKRAKALLRKVMRKDRGPGERLFRKTRPERLPGPRVPMNIDGVRDVAQRYGVEIRGIRFKLRKDLSGDHFGETREDHVVELTRKAFSNEHELAKTLEHERFHVADLRGRLIAI